MTPISFESAVHYFQETASQLTKATSKLDEALSVVSDVLVDSLGDEVQISLSAQEALSNESAWPVDSIGLFRFECKEAITIRGHSSDRLALGVGVLEQGEEGETVLRNYPLVQLPVRGAPRVASRRLRVWAGKNITRIVHRMAEKIAEEGKQAEQATESTIDSAARVSDRKLEELARLINLDTKIGDLKPKQAIVCFVRRGEGKPVRYMAAIRKAETEFHPVRNDLQLGGFQQSISELGEFDNPVKALDALMEKLRSFSAGS